MLASSQAGNCASPARLLVYASCVDIFVATESAAHLRTKWLTHGLRQRIHSIYTLYRKMEGELDKVHQLSKEGGGNSMQGFGSVSRVAFSRDGR
jgi:hypothetical protein